MDIESVCRQFQLLRENCHFEITYSLIHWYKNLDEKGIIT